FDSLAYATGKVDQCFNFTNDYASAGNSSVLNIGANADFSIKAWCKALLPSGPLGFPYSPDFYLVQKISSQTGPFPPLTVAISYSLLLDDGRLACQLSRSPFTSTNIPTFRSPGPDIRDGLFHHLAFTFHRNAAD